MRRDMPTFCDECGVSFDLHDGPDSCEWAAVKADQLARMEAIFVSALRGEYVQPL